MACDRKDLQALVERDRQAQLAQIREEELDRLARLEAERYNGYWWKHRGGEGQ